jgi:methyl-accepting chemotaxis protein
MTGVPKGPATEEPSWQRPLGHQVLFGIAGFLALLIGVVVMAIALVINLNHRETRLNRGNTAFVSAVQSAAFEAKAIANDQRGFMLSGDEQFLKEAEGRVAKVRAALTGAGASSGSSSELTTVNAARDGFERWMVEFQSEVDVFKAGDHQAAISTSLSTGRDLRKHYESSLASAQTIGMNGVRSGDHSVTAAATLTVRLLIAGLLVALIIGVGIGEWLLRTIVRPLHHLVDLLYQ